MKRDVKQAGAERRGGSIFDFHEVEDAYA
jgi:hypothetical protein